MASRVHLKSFPSRVSASLYWTGKQDSALCYFQCISYIALNRVSSAQQQALRQSHLVSSITRRVRQLTHIAMRRDYAWGDEWTPGGERRFRFNKTYKVLKILEVLTQRPNTLLFSYLCAMLKRSLQNIIFSICNTLQISGVTPFTDSRLYAFSNPKDFNK